MQRVAVRGKNRLIGLVVSWADTERVAVREKNRLNRLVARCINQKRALQDGNFPLFVRRLAIQCLT
ncbi:hypothetical protein Pjdr2_5883 [Paenibacillus sp. JDR-2]|nr:hypothetical protein Pjdr2_5883 [Paenibacillus sp. JDR-2]